MAYITDSSLDAALNYIKTEATDLHILKADPALTWENIATHGCGNKALEAEGASFTGPGDGDASGRKLTLDAITDGSVTDTQTASHYAIVDTAATTILASGALATTQAVTNGNTFTLTEIDITIPDAA